MASKPDKITAAALLLVLGATVSGCSEEPQAGSEVDLAPSEAASSSTNLTPVSDKFPELATWTDQMCTGIAASTETFEPVEIDQKDPEATLDGYATMFGRMAELQGDQLKGLAKVGPPPVKQSVAPFRKAVGRLQKARRIVSNAQRRLARADAGQGVAKALRTAGSLQVGGQPYPGFVMDLAQTDQTLGRVIRESATCKSLTTF
jgi:hypothetical protein